MRGGAFAGVVLATVCGVATAYATFQPALQEQKEKREGTFDEYHSTQEKQETVLSKAILDDMKEAGREVKNTGFAWGIRKALFERNPQPEAQKPAKVDPQRPETRVSEK